MSIQNRQSNLFAAEDWKVVYETFRQIDLNSYDFDTIRESMIDHLRATYPDTFNDWVENDEFIFILDTISYLGQNLAFRMDLNTRENFIDTAERRESVLRLASMLSYNPKRCYPARGLLKINQVTTTHDIRDSNGKSLAGIPINWNDSLNPDWYEQFILVMNSSFSEANPFGSPAKRYTNGSIVTQLYQMTTTSFSSVTEKFSATVNSESMNFEVVNPDIDSSGVYFERHPEPEKSKYMMYLNDGNGFSSPDTGFFLYFKQGSLKFEDYQFDLLIENRTVDIEVSNINELDVWVQSISDDGVVTDKWTKVPSTQNVVYNSVDQQVTEIYSVITNDNDQVSIRFPDSTSGTVPRGTFRFWYRVSNGESYTIKTTDIQNNSISYDYIASGTDTSEKTLDMRFSLQYQVQNAQAQETIDQIRARAPQNYYTSNRLINGEDYNIGPLQQGNLVLKSKAVNRTYSGHSRFIDINDPTGKYQNTDVFSELGIMYSTSSMRQNSAALPTSSTWESIITNSIQPLIYDVGAKTVYQEIGTDGAYWNTSDIEQNRKYRSEVSDEYKWSPSAGKTPYGAYGTFAPVVSSLVPYVTSGAVLLFEDTNDATQRVWTSVSAYNSTTGEYTLSTAIPSTGWKLIEYYPNLRSIFNQSEITTISSKLDLSENFGLVYDLNTLTWVTIPLTDKNNATYRANGWEELPDAVQWSSNTSYNINDYVIYNSKLYKSMYLHTSTTSFVSTNWKYIGSDLYNNWEIRDATDPYLANTFVVYNGSVYESNVQNYGVAFNTNEWDLISTPTQNANIRLWASSESYVVGDLVRYGTTIYQSIADFTPISTFNAANWSKIAGIESSIYDPLVLCHYTSKTWDFISPSLDYIFYGDNMGFYFTDLSDVSDINTGLAQSDVIKVLRSNYDPNNAGLSYDSDISLTIAANTTQVDGYIDYTRVKLAPPLDGFKNPLNPGLLDDVISGSASENIFWQRNDDNTEEYLDLSLVKRDETEKLTYDPYVTFFVLAEWDDITELYGKRQTIYGAADVVFAYQVDDEFLYFKIDTIINESNAITLSNFASNYTNESYLSTNNLSQVYYINNFVGRLNMHFLWKHYAPSNHRIDPAITNIHDIYVLTTSYSDDISAWATSDPTSDMPTPPTSTELRAVFNEIETTKALSDAIIWHSAKYIPLFGEGADNDYKCNFKVVLAQGSTISDDEAKQKIVTLINEFFAIDNWDFGESFFFTELSSYIHLNMITDVASIVIVPLNTSSKFGTLFEIPSEPDEVFVSTASVSNITIVDNLTVNNLRIGN